MPDTRLDDRTAARLLSVAVENLLRDHPAHWTHVIADDAELVPQRQLHPIFAGSFDWHSCVHQTWLAVRLLRLRPGLPGADEARRVLDSLITAEHARVEAAFFDGPSGGFWERPYGWAWLLVLDAELRTWGSPWAEELRPLSEVLRDRYLAKVVGSRLPVRTGTHGNTAFSTGLVLDAARAAGDEELAAACAAAALRWHREDAGYGGFEPSAGDFLSPGLTEADLMRRVLSPADFADWFEAFLPDLEEARWKSLREPVPVDEPGDPYGSHLVGLALSRARQWRQIAAALPPLHRYTALAGDAAESHRELGLHHVFGHGYYAEHWLGTFAAHLDLNAF
ncbi:DUF2891 domain-containing protein [Saccharothrix xinjiangensis]|uniref:DUF2891 domain-containing protein n=1 Tax=Saccharothrix xinjiangensis TaxID=204798 RepID=A0ABV9YE82_9PSEU